MIEDLHIVVSSDLDYEGMVVDIVDDQDRIATLNCDQGIENAEIVFFPSVFETNEQRVKFSTFVEYLNKAFEVLKEQNYIE